LAIDAAIRDSLQTYLSDRSGAPVTITALEPLAGGAVQENWRLDITVDGGDWPGAHDLVLKKDAPRAIATSRGRAEEYRLLKWAEKAGVVVPKPCLVCEDASIIGAPFFVMHRVEGEAAGFRLVKRGANDALAMSLGANLARIHAITPPPAEAGFLGVPPPAPALAAIATYRRDLDALPDAHPAIEWGLAWLEREAPPPGEVVLCHRDYRTGNFLVAGDGTLAAILDWEFAGWSDPLEDMGWFCAACWRFGARAREAGGIGSREAFYAGYEEASGRTIDRDRVGYWEVMAHVRWAVIALQQADRFVSGNEQNLEAALTAHVVPELELEILAMTEPA